MTRAQPLSPDQLSTLESYWQAQGAPIAGRLQAGLVAPEIDQLTGRLGLGLPVEARTWWGWHDGASAEGATTGFERQIGGPGFQYLSLQEAAVKYDELRNLAAEIAETAGDEPSFWWQESWFPITVALDGRVIACDCSVAEGQTTPIRVIKWGWGADFGDPKASSLGEMVNWWIEALARGAWRYDAREARWEYRYELLDPARELTGLV